MSDPWIPENLTPDEQAAVVEQVRASIPRPDAGQKDREREHLRAVLLAEAGQGEMPDPLGPDESPDVAIRQEFHEALDLAVERLPREVKDSLTSREAARIAAALEAQPEGGR